MSVINENIFSRRDLFRKISPFGRVDIESEKCTGCGLCASTCSTGAIFLLSNKDAFQIFFQHHLCIACGECTELCPEKCLGLERTLETVKIAEPARLLFQDRLAYCTKCNSPIGTETMIKKIQDKIRDFSKFFAEYPRLCSVCKVEVRFDKRQ